MLYGQNAIQTSSHTTFQCSRTRKQTWVNAVVGWVWPNVLSAPTATSCKAT